MPRIVVMHAVRPVRSASGPKAVTPLSVGSARFRVGAWQGSPQVAYLAPVTAAATLAPPVLAAVRDRLLRQGFRAVMTAAVAPPARDLLIDDGYCIRSELTALSLNLDAAPALPDPGGRTRRARRRDLEGVLRVDNDAFGPFWRLDAEGLHDARTATPRSRWRVNRGPEVTAYSITGLAGSTGYLQRLAVAAERQGRGLGTLLLADAMAWLRRAGARTALVNTPPDNERALAFYRRGGFQVEPHRLAVLYRDLA